MVVIVPAALREQKIPSVCAKSFVRSVTIRILKDIVIASFTIRVKSEGQSKGFYMLKEILSDIKELFKETWESYKEFHNPLILKFLWQEREYFPFGLVLVTYLLELAVLVLIICRIFFC